MSRQKRRKGKKAEDFGQSIKSYYREPEEVFPGHDPIEGESLHRYPKNSKQL